MPRRISFAFVAAVRGVARLGGFVALAAAGAILAGGCAYKSEVRQGAPLPEESISQLREGMTKDEVINLLGAPQSEYLFRDNIWLYYHKKRPAGFSPQTSVVSVEITFDGGGRVAGFKILIDERPPETAPENAEDADADAEAKAEEETKTE